MHGDTAGVFAAQEKRQFADLRRIDEAALGIGGFDVGDIGVAGASFLDFGYIARAAAMCMMIVYTSAGVRLLHYLLTRGLARRTQAWRER